MEINNRIKTLESKITALKFIINSNYYNISGSEIYMFINHRNNLKKELVKQKSIQQLRDVRISKLNKIYETRNKNLS